MKPSYDAVIVGSGPNGLAAAITIARTGRSVLVVEGQKEAGGGARSGELTLPGFTHDLFSAVHPLARESLFFQSLPLENYGLEWIHSPAVFAQPLADGTAAMLYRSIDETSANLGRDAAMYRRVFKPLLEDWPHFKTEVLRPIRFPRHPFRFAKFGLPALAPAKFLAQTVFRGTAARALFGGAAAHSSLPLEALGSGAFGLTLMLAGHNVGWPIPRGGAKAISQSLIAYLLSLGGEIETDMPVKKLEQLPRAGAVLLDLTPRQILEVAGESLSAGFRGSLSRYRYGPGVFKLDWALRSPIPWKAAEAAKAVTVHIGADLEEMAFSERETWRDRVSERPYILLTQPSLFDSTRAPQGRHTAWAYCHIPNGSTVDMQERMEAQIERFAPGFQESILARHVFNPANLQQQNENLVGGDINGGASSLRQLFLRPTARIYSTSRSDLFICSSSTPPGGGVHGLGGYHAAQEALKSLVAR